ncbi:IclR family transcriptional regulator [Halalkalibacter oceani]|uniref:IclR family transcriptional regulator n=1 Tax=Halalkalibacter oceani TaxID=1653776 RepID=UPI0033948DA4
MTRKYWVPAIERADKIIALLAQEPSSLRLMDLANRLDIHKSSMYSLLSTLESLGWVTKEKGDTYALGPTLGVISASYFRQFNLMQSFHQEARMTVRHVGEAVQLAMLDRRDVVYLAKEESASPMRLVSDPGMRFAAYATALGKIQLSHLPAEELDDLFPEEELEPKTKYTVATRTELYEQLGRIRQQQIAVDRDEAVEGFCCVAAPIYNHTNKMIAAVSISMSSTVWKEKEELAREEIIRLGQRISQHAGYQKEERG